MTDFSNLAEFLGAFPDEKACRLYFEAIRFADGDFCPHCGHDQIMRFKDAKRYRCHSCRKDFTIKTGTIFGESKIPLKKWFIAIYLLTTRKKGISSIELATQVGVTQKTAWFMDMRIRESLQQGKGKLKGIVQVDETYVGGKHLRKDGFRKKTPVMGMTEQGGKVKAFQIEERAQHIILGHIMKHVDQKAFIMSDEAKVYKKLAKTNYQHGSVKHGKKHWKHGDVTTNSIESFWALFKRTYHGTYHSMSKKHLQRYINEVTFRFNHRELSLEEAFAEVLNKGAKHGILPYKKLTYEPTS